MEDQRAQPIGLQHAPQQFAGAEEVILTDEFLDGARTHPGRQRLGLAEVGFMKLMEQVDGRDLSIPRLPMHNKSVCPVWLSGTYLIPISTFGLNHLAVH